MKALSVCGHHECTELVRSGYCPKHQPPARPGRVMPTDWKRTRARIIRRDQGICQLKLDGCKGKATSCDHVIPASQGGTDDDSNLVASCWPCNQKKGARRRTSPGGGG